MVYKCATQVHTSVTEALGFLEARKEFWQQQNPVYARDNAAKVRRKKKRCN